MCVCVWVCGYVACVLQHVPSVACVSLYVWYLGHMSTHVAEYLCTFMFVCYVPCLRTCMSILTYLPVCGLASGLACGQSETGQAICPVGRLGLPGRGGGHRLFGQKAGWR